MLLRLANDHLSQAVWITWANIRNLRIELADAAKEYIVKYHFVDLIFVAGNKQTNIDKYWKKIKNWSSSLWQINISLLAIFE